MAILFLLALVAIVLAGAGILMWNDRRQQPTPTSAISIDPTALAEVAGGFIQIARAATLTTANIESFAAAYNRARAQQALREVQAARTQQADLDRAKGEKR